MLGSAWRRLLPIAVTVGSLAYVFTRFDVGEVAHAVSWRAMRVLIPALLCYGAITLFLEAVSLLRLISERPPGFGLWTLARIKCATYLLAIVNYTLGVAALTVLLRRRAGLRLGEAAGTVLLISFTDLAIVLALGAVGVAIALDSVVLHAGVVAAAGVAGFGGFALLRVPGSLGPLDRIRSLSVFDAVRRTPLAHLVQLAAIRTVFVCCFIGVGASAFYAFGIDVEAAHLIGGVMVLALVGSLPIALAGIGPGQIATVEVFRGVAPPETLIALSLVLSAGLVATRTGMGALFSGELTREAIVASREETA